MTRLNTSTELTTLKSQGWSEQNRVTKTDLHGREYQEIQLIKSQNCTDTCEQYTESTARTVGYVVSAPIYFAGTLISSTLCGVMGCLAGAASSISFDVAANDINAVHRQRVRDMGENKFNNEQEKIAEAGVYCFSLMYQSISSNQTYLEYCKPCECPTSDPKTDTVELYQEEEQDNLNVIPTVQEPPNPLLVSLLPEN
ncbi:MAG: hypothetical protein S4CHLAM7_13370 [Chlamydiae bacterium]|nr:hypothetical protein [Chlamydiota bacterium]